MTMTNQPKPLFPLKATFYDSLNNYVQQVTLLESALESILLLPNAVVPGAAKIIRERLDALAKASHHA